MIEKRLLLREYRDAISAMENGQTVIDMLDRLPIGPEVKRAKKAMEQHQLRWLETGEAVLAKLAKVTE